MANKEYYFGKIQDGRKKPKHPYEFFCRMMKIYENYDRTQLAIQMKMKPSDPRIAGMSDQQLRECISERIALQVADKQISTLDAE